MQKSNRGRKKNIDGFYTKKKKKDNSAKYNKTRVCIGPSSLAKGYDLRPPSLQKKKGDPNRNPLLAKMP